MRSIVVLGLCVLLWGALGCGDDGPGGDVGPADTGAGDSAADAADGGLDAGSDADGGAADTGTDAVATTASATFVFPPGAAITDEDRVTVRGTATADAPIDAVRVDGVDATSGDAFASWTATVPLAEGANALEVSIDAAGVSFTTVASVTVTRSSHWLSTPGSLTRSSAGGLIYVAELDVVYAVDSASGERSIVSGGGVGSGPALTNVQALVFDDANTRLIAQTGRLLAIDPTTGDRTDLGMGASTFAGDLAVNAGGDTAYVAGPGGVFEVDLATGASTTLDSFSSSTGVAIDAPRDRLLLTSAGRVLAHSLSTGTLSDVSGMGVGSGPTLGSLNGIHVAETGDEAYVHAADEIWRVDLTTGDRSSVWTPGTGSGPAILSLTKAHVDGSRLLLSSDSLSAIVAMDPTTGDRTLVSGHTLGAGLHLVSPSAVLLDGDVLYVGDAATGALSTLDVDGNGDRTVVSAAAGPALPTEVGAGVGFGAIDGLAIDGSGTIWIADRDRTEILQVDPTSGDRTVFSGAAAGSGPALGPVGGLVLDPGRSRAVTSGHRTLFAIDDATGDRTTVDGTGPALVDALDIAFDETGDRYLLPGVGTTTIDLLAVDPDSGDRAVVSSSAIGGGAMLPWPCRLTVDAAGTTVISSHPASGGRTGALLGRFDLATGDRSVLSSDVHRGPALRQPTSPVWDEGRDVVFVADAGRGVVFAVDASTGERLAVSK